MDGKTWTGKRFIWVVRSDSASFYAYYSFMLKLYDPYHTPRYLYTEVMLIEWETLDIQ